MKTLVLVEHEGGAIKDATLAAVTAAAKLGEVHLLVAGKGVGGVAEAAAKIAGVGKVHVADAAHLEHQLAEDVAPLAAKLMADHDAFLAPATTTGKNIAPRVAALLDVMQISEILIGRGRGHLHPPDLRRQRHRDGQVEGRQEGHHRARHRLREGGARGRHRARSKRSTPAAMTARPNFVSAEMSKSERPELTSAKIIVSGGRAFGSNEQFHGLLDPLADKLGAAVGASRAAVDAGYAPNDYQVGQTGKIVAPEVYIAIGISGAIQHLAGMKDSKTIVAINKDEEAPIFQVADIGLVGDLFKIVPELTEKL